jgi:NitT/TauT family transport system substrate-binding protein
MEEPMKALAVLTALIALMSGPVLAQAPEKSDVKMVLDFAFQGNHMFFTRGVDGGHYKREGLNVTVDRGYGSADTMTKIASRSYDFGFADANALVKFNADNPESRVIIVLPVFDRSLVSAISLKSHGVSKPADLAGKTFAGSEGEASRLMFPAFARAVGIDPASIKWMSVASNLREAMLIKNQTQAMSGFASTAFFNLMATGVDVNDIIIFPYADYGLDIYGNAVVVREDFAAQYPNTVSAFVRGSIVGMIDAMKDPAQGIASLRRRDGLLKADLELDRYKFIAERAILTPSVKQHGVGHLDKARLERAIATVAEAFGVKNPPTADQIATDKFLPPREARILPQ